MIDPSIIAIWALALGLFAFAATKPGGLHRRALTMALRQLALIGPRLVIAMLAAGFIARLVPTEPIAAALGPDSGWRGILLASVVGGMVPSGPLVSFPIVLILDRNGAGWPQIVAFLSAWSVFALHRVIAWEIPLMGWRFSRLRLACSLPIPPLAGFGVGWLMGWLA